MLSDLPQDGDLYQGPEVPLLIAFWLQLSSQSQRSVRIGQERRTEEDSKANKQKARMEREVR